ncbi:MAG TPA: FtsX-like permease family protein, partial [Longimicrobiales bacterium]|nr:FtsX-like permease family protein [Longimicrobiales bacterium]
ARAAGVRRLVVRQGLALVAAGLAAGTLAALLATRALESLLYGIGPTDPLTWAAVIAVLGGVALAACWVPARRAAAIDPASTLRLE